MASKLIIGTANFYKPYGIKCGKQVTRQEVENILTVAIANGINLIDTSTVYIQPDAYPVKIIKTIECPDDINHYFNILELAHGFDKIPDRKWGGISVDTPDEAVKAAEMKMGTIEFPYNIINHEIYYTKFFDLTKRNRITIIARSVFLQGLLLMDDPPIGTEYIEILDNIIKPYGISRKETAFLFVYCNNNIDHIVIGIDTAAQLEELISLTKYTLPLSLVEKIMDMPVVPEEIKYPWRWKL